MNAFRISGLPTTRFSHLFGLTDAELAAYGATRYQVDTKPGFPDRIELRDMELGESALLLQYIHQPADTAYRSSHAIFVRDGAVETYDRVSEVPEVLRIRPLSLRAFNVAGLMVDAELVDGVQLPAAVTRLFLNTDTAYIQAHYAIRGCYAARIDRA